MTTCRIVPQPRRIVSGIAWCWTMGARGGLPRSLADAYDTGSDGAPSSVRFVLLPFVPQQ